MARLFRPDYDEWKTNTFPELLCKLIKAYLKDFYSHLKGHSVEKICRDIQGYLECNISEKVFDYFEEEGYISPDLEVRSYPYDTNLLRYVEISPEIRDIPYEYRDLEELCDDIPGLISAHVTEFLSEKAKEDTTSEEIES